MPEATPKFQVGDYVRLTREWSAHLESSKDCTHFRPYIGSTFLITGFDSTGEGCYIRPTQGKEGFWFRFDKLRTDPFLGEAQKAVRNA